MSEKIKQLASMISLLNEGELNDLSDQLINNHDIYIHFSLNPYTDVCDNKKIKLFLADPSMNRIRCCKLIADTLVIGLYDAKKLIDTIPSLLREFDDIYEAREMKKLFDEHGISTVIFE